MTDTYNVAKTKICYWDIINRTQILLNLFVTNVTNLCKFVL